MIHKFSLGFVLFSLICCVSPNNKETTTENTTENKSKVRVVGAMKNVMWKGQLGASIQLDTISNKTGLYALGPESYLTGEILINNGVSYVSRVESDSTMVVNKTVNTSAPFLVYTHETEWNEIKLPTEITSIKQLENYVDEQTQSIARPFAFKLIGKIDNGSIHIQNLAKGSKVSSPEEAHRGQVSYELGSEEVTIVGFFSTQHKGIFTHHDTYIHLHLITKDESKMGHLDKVSLNNVTLFLPKK